MRFTAEAGWLQMKLALAANGDRGDLFDFCLGPGESPNCILLQRIAVSIYVFPDFQGTGVCKINVGFKMRITAQPPFPHHNVESRTQMSECKVLQNKRGFVVGFSVDLFCSTL